MEEVKRGFLFLSRTLCCANELMDEDEKDRAKRYGEKHAALGGVGTGVSLCARMQHDLLGWLMLVQ